jgi:hypothetical protein
MTDQELALDALHKTSLIISEYLEPGPRDAKTTLDALILILDDQALGDAVDRLEVSPLNKAHSVLKLPPERA